MQTVVYTHTGNFAHAGVQYAPNGAFIQTPMNIAPMNMTQGKLRQCMERKLTDQNDRSTLSSDDGQ